MKGRTDDVVLTSSGEKINPDVLEAIITLPSVERFSLLGLEENGLNYLSLVLELNKNLSVKEKLYIEKLDKISKEF